MVPLVATRCWSHQTVWRWKTGIPAPLMKHECVLQDIEVQIGRIFWPLRGSINSVSCSIADWCKSSIDYSFSSIFALHHLLQEITFSSLAAKRLLLTSCRWLLGRQRTALCTYCVRAEWRKTTVSKKCLREAIVLSKAKWNCRARWRLPLSVSVLVSPFTYQ